MPPSQGLSGSAFITSQETPEWVSCRVITANLRSAYQIALGGKKPLEFRFTTDMNDRALELEDDEVLKLAERIHAAQPERLIFLDHAPHPLPLIEALAQVYGEKKLPNLYFHVFGDFSLMAYRWLRACPIIAKTQLIFICASGRQAAFVSNLLIAGGFSVDICPFPVDTSLFKPNEKSRQDWRKKHQIQSDEIVFLYTGRMSLQKNIVHLLQQFAIHKQKSKKPMRLLLAGPFDDVGAPFFGIIETPGDCYRRYKEALEALPESVRKCVQYLGNKTSPELVELYNAADYYVNLSLHHDEDFGMAPAEALCTGLPSILTSWGGFTGFASVESDDCRFIPVGFHKNKDLQIDLTAFQSELDLATSKGPSQDFNSRIERARRYDERFSVASAVTCLRTIHNKPLGEFLGFNGALKALAYSMEETVPFPDGMNSGSFYEMVYSTYFK